MDWWVALIFIFGGLVILMAIGLPVGFAFLLTNIIGVYFFWGGEPGLGQFILSIYTSVTNFSLLPVPLFFLMGEIMFRSDLADSIMETLDIWLGALPGRLSILAVGAGTLLSVLTGVPMASVAMMGRTLVPEMEKRGYHKTMAMGPILASGGLATLIPPSALGVLLAALAGVSVSKLLIAGIVPGLFLACLFTIYILIMCKLRPHLAPTYDLERVSFNEKIKRLMLYILPLALVIFMVIGIMMLGIGTPTEAAAGGVLACLILAGFHKKLSWKLLKDSFLNTASLTIMVYIIIAGSTAFSQMLAFSQASKGLVNLATRLPLSPILLVLTMQLALLLLGCFMDAFSIMMITIPIFFPIINSLGMNELWFAVLMLLNIEVAPITPPFGLELFVMKGVAPSGTTMMDIYRSAIPFLIIDISLLLFILLNPPIVLWLPGLM